MSNNGLINIRAVKATVNGRGKNSPQALVWCFFDPAVAL